MTQSQIKDKIATLQEELMWLEFSDALGTARKMEAISTEIRSLERQL